VIWDLRSTVPVLEPFTLKNQLTDTSLPSARLVSNLLFKDTNYRENERRVSLFELTYGQFFSHDLSYLPLSTDPQEADFVPVPACDETFDPECWGNRTLRVPRLVLQNKATGWFDLSHVYGSDERTARALRSLSAGKLILDAEGYLPTKYVFSLHLPRTDPRF
jgi:hypothetical protein